jgi:hypothetical protein
VSAPTCPRRTAWASSKPSSSRCPVAIDCSPRVGRSSSLTGRATARSLDRFGRLAASAMQAGPDVGRAPAAAAHRPPVGGVFVRDHDMRPDAPPRDRLREESAGGVREVVECRGQPKGGERPGSWLEATAGWAGALRTVGAGCGRGCGGRRPPPAPPRAAPGQVRGGRHRAPRPGAPGAPLRTPPGTAARWPCDSGRGCCGVDPVDSAPRGSAARFPCRAHRTRLVRRNDGAAGRLRPGLRHHPSTTRTRLQGNFAVRR